MDAVRKANLDRAFNPRVVAVVGDKKASDYMWLKSVRDVKDAKVYSVQIDESEIPGILAMGVPNLRSLREVPEPAIDYVICAVPRQVAPRIVQDCIELKVGAVALFTSGFAETGEDLGVQLQERLAQMCRQAGLNLVGPNCMCLYHGAAGLRNTADQWIGPGGSVSFMSNSGSFATNFVTRARVNGIYPNKSISMGNAIAVDQAEWLEYLGQDPGTQVIGMYIEGTRNGRRFFEVLREVASRKPVVIWKGGATPEGARAAASHTGHLASPMILWDAMIRQTGAIGVETQDELMDALKALLLMKPATGDRMGIVAAAGGPSVTISDAFGRARLKVPSLQEETYERLRPIVTLVGGSWRNPVEGGGSLTDLQRPREILDALAKDGNTDIIVMEVNLGFVGRRLQRQGQGIEDLIAMLRDFRDASPKPFGVIATWNQDEAGLASFRTQLAEGGIAVFPTYQDAARAIRHVVDYHQVRVALAAGD